MSSIDPLRIVSTDSPGMRRVRKVLDETKKPLDGHTIADRACISFTTFANTYRHLLIREKKMHIAAYRNNTSGPFVPLYRSGPLVGDAPPFPKKKDPKIASHAWRERTGYYEAEKAKRRLARPPDLALAALAGLTPRYHKRTNAVMNSSTAREGQKGTQA